MSLHMLGSTSIDTVEEGVKDVGKKVSPWLWILSITGFGLGLISRWQIHQMYGSYKKMREALRK